MDDLEELLNLPVPDFQLTFAQERKMMAEVLDQSDSDGEDTSWDYLRAPDWSAMDARDDLPRQATISEEPRLNVANLGQFFEGMDVAAAQPQVPPTEAIARRGRGRPRLPSEERLRRKKEYEKNASKRYRHKKSDETVANGQQLEAMEKRNRQMAAQVEAIRKEYEIYYPLIRQNLFDSLDKKTQKRLEVTERLFHNNS